MRIAFHTIYRTSVERMAQAQVRVADLQAKLVSGRKFLYPSDDPLGAEKTIVFNQTLSSLERIHFSANSAMTYLQSAESDLLQLNDLMRQAHNVAVSQRDASADADTRAGEAQEILAIRNQIKDILNHQVNGRYLFAGHESQTLPFVEVGGVITYRGDGGKIPIRIGRDAMVVSNIPGADLLTYGTPALSSTSFLQPNLSGATEIPLLAGGQGISGGIFEIEDEFGTVLQVDMSTVTTVQNLINTINTSALDITAQIGGTGKGIELVAGNAAGTIDVREVGGGSAAKELRILGTSTGTLTGGNLEAIIGNNTLLTDVPQFPVLPMGRIKVDEGGALKVVDFGAAPPIVTVGDLMTRFNSSVSGLAMSVNRSGSGFEITGSGEFTISDLGADTTATQLGLIGTGRSAELFGGLERLYQALLANDVDGIDAAIEETDEVLNGLVNRESVLGSRLLRVGASIDLLDQREIGVTAQLADVADLDMAVAIGQLSEAQTTYEAALATAMSLSQMNLLNFL